MKKNLQTVDLQLVPIGNDAGAHVSRHKRASYVNKRIHTERRCSSDRRESVRFERTRRSGMERRHTDQKKHFFGEYGH